MDAWWTDKVKEVMKQNFEGSNVKTIQRNAPECVRDKSKREYRNTIYSI